MKICHILINTMQIKTLFLLLSSVLFLSFNPNFIADATNDIELLNIDTYEKTINPGESATYTWTIRRIDTKELNYTVYIETSEPKSGWDANIKPNLIESLPPLSAKGITLKVTSREDTKGMLNLTVTFTVYQDGAIILNEKRYAVTKVYAPIPATEKKWFFGTRDNPLPPPLDGDVGIFLLDILTWLGISFFIFFIFDPFIKAFTKKTKTKLDDMIVKITRTPIFILIFTYGIVISTTHLDKYLPLIIIDYLHRLWGIVFWLVILYLCWKMFRDVIIHYGKKIAEKTETKIDDIVIPIVEKIGMVVIIVIAIMYVFGYIGIDLTMFVAGGVVVSMVIAFAAQETLSNFFSGIFIMTDRPFKEGDVVILPDDDWYEVRKIGIRSTKLFRYKDASLVTIPNNKLANEKIANFSSVDDKGRVMLTVGVAYGSDSEKVKRVIRGVIEKCEYIINDNPDLKPIVRFDKMGESSLDFFILVWVTDRNYRFDVLDYLNTNIYNRFNEEGIEIPFPQRVVHIKKMDEI
ncbi:MAG: mechanosensitive ion channel domain-containing protein [Candidatus Thermoplasmatota archaeon]